MNAAHRMISLDKASAGMVLSAAILDRQGQVLLAHGTVLTGATLAALGRHEVAMLSIAIEGEAAPPVDVAVVTARLAHLFRAVGAGSTSPSETANVILQRHVAYYRLGAEVAP